MNKIIENLAFGIAAVFILAAIPVDACAQNNLSVQVPRQPTTAAQPQAESRVTSAPKPDALELANWDGETSERSIKVDSGVYIDLCVTQGTVKVNGWQRDEVRVLVDNGSKFGFNVRQSDAKTGRPVLINVVGLDKKNKAVSANPCIWGDEIEIDAPVNAIINLKGEETTTTIDSVKRVVINTIGGNISLRNIANGITAAAGQGDITVEASSGAMLLDSNTGNILVYEAGPREIGDLFKAKTFSGAISLQRLEYRQVEVNSITGSVAFNGDILSGGSYRLSTSKGSIRMSIPVNASFQFSAIYGYGDFNSELPIKIQTEDIRPGLVKNIVGIVGTGSDATLKLTTNNGSITIKKQ